MQVLTPATPSADDAGVSSSALTERFQHALTAISPRPQQHRGVSPLAPDVAARFLLAANYPIISPTGAYTRPFWCEFNADVVSYTHHAELSCISPDVLS